MQGVDVFEDGIHKGIKRGNLFWKIAAEYAEPVDIFGVNIDIVT